MFGQGDRENLLVALANNGYKVRIVEKEKHNSASSDYYVYCDVPNKDVLKVDSKELED